MDVLKADLSATLEGFRTDMANFREDAEKRDKDAAYRGKANIQWMAGLVLGADLRVSPQRRILCDRGLSGLKTLRSRSRPDGWCVLLCGSVAFG